jgi:hypothetical protein
MLKAMPHALSSLPLHVALAGGPNAGKSTLVHDVAGRFRAQGYRVVVMPEMATWLYTHGVEDVGRIAAERPEGYRAIQTVLGLGIRDLRVRLNAMCQAIGDPAVILSDRGELDMFVYLDAAVATEVAASGDLSLADLLSELDAVCYMATGAAHADLASNPARRETDIDSALDACQRTWKVWGEHARIQRIDARDDFSAKRHAVLDWVDALVEADRAGSVGRGAAERLLLA